MEQPSLSSSRAVVVYLFLYCLVSSSLLFDISGAHAYVKQVANGTGAPLLIKRLESPSSNLDFMELLFPESHFNCEGVVNFTQKRGFIKSPNYPNGYTVPLFCRWNIVGAVDEIITISLTLIDIEIPSESPIHCYRTAEFQASLCCARNYLKITSSGGGGGGGSYSSVGGPSSSRARDQSQQQQQQQQLYCGDSSLQWQTYTSTSNVVAVEFNALDNYAHARGFYLEYSIHPRRSAALAAASATSADDSAVCPEGKFQCAASKLCIDAERRCNGVADCDHHHIDQDESHPNSSPHVPDFSDELNCTSQLCRPEKGAFLCSDGRCILSPWSCDQDCSDEKGNGGTPGTVGCLKNSVITAAIIGSLVCLLLIVIAISCAIRLFGLRHSGHYRSSLLATGRSASPTSAAAAAAAGHHGHHGHGHHHHHHHLPPFADSVLPFPPLMSTGDLDASLFRLDHSVFLREPPPSYASTMGGYADVPAAGAGGVNGLGVGGASASASYMEQYRRYRRQRRCRRLLRRQQRMAAGGGGGGAATAGTAAQSAGDVGTCTSPPPIDEETLAHHRQPRYHHHHQGHQFVNPLPLSPTAAAAADISLRGTAHHHHHQFATVVGLRINPIILSDSSAAVGLPALPSSGAFNGGSSATTATTLPPPSQPPPSFQANILQQESCFEVGGGTSSSSTSKMKKKGGTSLTSSDLNHLNTQCNSSPGGGGVATSTTFGVLPFSSASSSAASTSAASSAGAVDAATALTIELEPIPPLLTNFDCDSLPLIR